MNVLFNVCLLVMSLTAIAGVFIYNRLNAALRWVFFAVTFSILTELAGLVSRIYIGDNRLVFSLANPVETSLLVMFFLAIIPQKKVRWIALVMVTALCAATLINTFLLFRSPIPYLFFIVIKGIAITVLCVIYFFNLFSSNRIFLRPDINLIIVVTGLLFYYSFSTLFFSIWNYQMNHHTHLSSILKLRPFLYVIYLITQSSILYIFVKISIEKKASENAGYTERP